MSDEERRQRLEQLREDMRNPEPLRRELVRQVAAQRKTRRAERRTTR